MLGQGRSERGQRGNLARAPDLKGPQNRDRNIKRVPLRLGGGATENFAPGPKIVWAALCLVILK